MMADSNFLFNFLATLKTYQLFLESLAILLFLSSFFSLFIKNKKAYLWSSFLRRSSLLLAFSSLAIPWMFSEMLMN